MRRKAGIAVTAAVVLAGAAGVVAWQVAGNDEGRPVGTWHDAPEQARTPVAESRPMVPKAGDPAGSAPVVGSAGQPVNGRDATGNPVVGSTRVDSIHIDAGNVDSTRPDMERVDSASVDSARVESARVESAQVGGASQAGAAKAGGAGRQRVGQLLRVDRLLGYLGRSTRTETFRYPGASYVKLHFGRMAMLPGDYLTVSNPSKTESYRYAAPSVLNTGRVDKWAMSITGDTAVLEVHRGPASAATSLLGSLGVNVDRVARGNTRTEQAKEPEAQLSAPGRTGREESVCGPDTSADAACYKSSDPVAYTKSKAIARLLINGTELCTGWRVGTQNRMLTNNHCFTTSGEAYDTEVWFNYQCAKCGGYDVFQPTKVWGSKVLSTDKVYDYTLFSVDNFAAVQKFGYLTLDGNRPAKGQDLYVPQHPAGEPARIAGALGDKAGNCAVIDPAYDGYATNSDVAYYCDTEGGSSGSPVLSRKTGKVVALHHFGGCPNSGVRGDLLAAKLRSYL